MAERKKAAKYHLIAEEIRHGIAEGKYRPGEKLETEEALAVRHGVSRLTARHALTLLAEEGLVRQRQGSGTFVSDNPLPRGRTRTIGVIVTYISEYILPSIIRGIEDVCSQNDYVFQLRSTDNRMDKERDLLEYFLENPVDGIIVEGAKTAFPNPNLALYRKLSDAGVPIVFMSGWYPAFSNCVYVASDDYSGGQIAAEHLISRGHTRIGGIFKMDDIQGLNRFSGFVDAARAHNIELHDDSLLWYTTDQRLTLFDEDHAAENLRRFEDCTAIICYNDQIAAPLLSALLTAGKRVPEDVSVVSFDNSTYAAFSPVGLTSLSHPKEEVGRTAARKLLAMIEGKKETSVLLGWQLIKRKSTQFYRTERM